MTDFPVAGFGEVVGPGQVAGGVDTFATYALALARTAGSVSAAMAALAPIRNVNAVVARKAFFIFVPLLDSDVFYVLVRKLTENDRSVNIFL